MGKVKIIGANVCQIETVNGTTFLQSYSSVVAKRGGGKIVLSSYWDYSKTTAKHVAQWIGKSAKEIRAEIQKGVIQVSPSNSLDIL